MPTGIHQIDCNRRRARRARARLLPQMLISSVVAAAAASTLWVEIKYMLRVDPPPPFGLTQNGQSHFNCERNEVYFNFDGAGTLEQNDGCFIRTRKKSSVSSAVRPAGLLRRGYNSHAPIDRQRCFAGSDGRERRQKRSAMQ